MAHHRCSRCKQEAYPRHKRMGFLVCEPCLREMQYGSFFRGRGLFSSMFGFAWDWLKTLTERVFRPNVKRSNLAQINSAVRTRQKAMVAKAQSIPMDPGSMFPQKR